MRIITDDTHVLTVPADGGSPIQEDLSCWECGNSLDIRNARSVPIVYGGLDLRVPMCSVCAPSEPQTELEAAIASLTLRERQALELAAKGLCNKAIAERLGGVNVGTVKKHLGTVFHKLGVRSRWEATQRYTLYMRGQYDAIVRAA